MRKGLLIFIFITLFMSSFGAGFRGEIIAKDQKLTVDFRSTELIDVVRMISRNFDLNILAGEDVKGKVTVSLSEVLVDDALEMILKMNGYTYIKEGNIVRVTTLENAKKEFGAKSEIKSGEDSKKLYKVFEIKNIKAESISDKIRSLIKSDGRIIVDENSNKIVAFIDKEEIAMVENILSDLDVAGGKEVSKTSGKEENTIIPLRYTSGSAIETIIRDIYPEMNAQIKVNDNVGLIVRGDQEDIEKIEEMVRKYDLQPLQISIEAKIVEITGQDTKTIGMDWSYNTNQAGAADTATIGASSAGASLTGTQTDGGKINFGIISDDKFSATLKALLSNTNSNLLSSPNITTLSGKPAVITVGDKIPYPVAAEEGEPVTYQFEEVGIKLEVTPVVIDNNIINMMVKPKVSNQNGTTLDNRPIVATRDADTNVIVKDGETLVIGGLMRQNEINNVVKVPVLGSIPLLGALFRTKSITKQNTNLIFFITPRIISGGKYEVKNTAQKKDKFNDIEKMKLENKKIIIKEYEENGSYDRALYEIDELRKNGLVDKEIDSSYNRIKEKRDKQK